MAPDQDTAHLGDTPGFEDQTRSEPQLSQTGSTTNWRPAFDSKVERLAINNKRIRAACSWKRRTPPCELYLSRLSDPPAPSGRESSDQKSPKQQSSDQGVDQPSSETSIHFESALDPPAVSPDGEDVSTIHAESENAPLTAGEPDDLVFKHALQNPSTGLDANSPGGDSHAVPQPLTEPGEASADGSWSCTAEAVDAARLRVTTSLVDACHSPAHADADADGEAYSSRLVGAHGGDDAVCSEMLAPSVQGAIGLAGERREAMVEPDENRTFVAAGGLMQNDTTLREGVWDPDLSRPSSTVPSLKTYNGSRAADNAEYDLFYPQISIRVKAAIAWWDESSRKARQSLDDTEDSSSEYSIIDQDTLAVSRAKDQKKVRFDAAAMQRPEDGPDLTMRNSEDREVIRAQMVMRGFKTELDELLESKTTQQLGARMRKFVELQRTHGTEEANAYLRRPDVEEDGLLDGDEAEDGSISQRRCLELNLKIVQSEVPGPGIRFWNEREDEDEQQLEDETTPRTSTKTGRKRLSGMLGKLSLARSRSQRRFVSEPSSRVMESSSVADPTPPAPPRPWRAPEWI